MSIISDTETIEQEQELYIVLSDTTTETTEVSVTTEGTDSELYVSEYEYIYDSGDEMTAFDIICEFEKEYMDSEKKDGQYVIGISASGFNNDGHIFACGVSAKTFLNFSYRDVLKYLFYNSVIMVHYPIIDIIKIYIDKNDVYNSICKTFWLSLIQRHWKKVMAEKREIQRKKRTILSQFHFAIHGRFPKTMNSIPSINGMMSCYNKR